MWQQGASSTRVSHQFFTKRGKKFYFIRKINCLNRFIPLILATKEEIIKYIRNKIEEFKKEGIEFELLKNLLDSPIDGFYNQLIHHHSLQIEKFSRTVMSTPHYNYLKFYYLTPSS